MLWNRRLRRNRDSKPAEIRPPRFHTEREHERRTAATRRGLRDRRGAHSLGEVRPAGWRSRRTAGPVPAPPDGMPPYKGDREGREKSGGCHPPSGGEIAGRCPSPDGRLVAAAESEAFTPLPLLGLLLPGEGAVLPGAARSIPALGGSAALPPRLPPLPAPVAWGGPAQRHRPGGRAAAADRAELS